MNYSKKTFIAKVPSKTEIEFQQKDRIITNMKDLKSFVLSFWLQENECILSN